MLSIVTRCIVDAAGSSLFLLGNGQGSELFSSPHIWVLTAAAMMLGLLLAVFAVSAFGSVAQRKHGPDSLALPVAPDATPLDRLAGPLAAPVLPFV